MLEDTVNAFRVNNGVGSISNWDKRDQYNCKLHCLAMARERNVFHTPSYYIEDWDEAVAACQYSDNWESRIINEVLGYSEPHRNLILNNSILACNYHIQDWIVYVTIRGK